jgi:hypothetical protein
MSEKEAVDALASALAENKKGLSMKTVKQVIAKAFGIQRVHLSRMKPVLELGRKLQLFVVKGKRVVAYVLEAPEIPGFEDMSREAQEYYVKAVTHGPTYKEQAERYASYCNDCKRIGTRAVHPKLWMAGYMDASRVPIDELVPVEPTHMRR